MLFSLIFAFISVIIHGEMRYNPTTVESIGEIIVVFLCILPHELIYAFCFGKDAELEPYTFLRYMTIFVILTKALSKHSFIVLSLLLSILFGVIPLILWTFLPGPAALLIFLFPFALVSILFEVGDDPNVYNAITQIPKQSY